MDVDENLNFLNLDLGLTPALSCTEPAELCTSLSRMSVLEALGRDFAAPNVQHVFRQASVTSISCCTPFYLLSIVDVTVYSCKCHAA